LVNTAGAPFDGRDSNTNENVIYYEMMESYAYNKHIIAYIQAYMITVNNKHIIAYIQAYMITVNNQHE